VKVVVNHKTTKALNYTKIKLTVIKRETNKKENYETTEVLKSKRR